MYDVRKNTPLPQAEPLQRRDAPVCRSRGAEFDDCSARLVAGVPHSHSHAGDQGNDDPGHHAGQVEPPAQL